MLLNVYRGIFLISNRTVYLPPVLFFAIATNLYISFPSGFQSNYYRTFDLGQFPQAITTKEVSLADFEVCIFLVGVH